MSHFAYFPGCSLHATAREYDESIRALAGTLDFGLEEIRDWCCCGATPAHALSGKLLLMAHGRGARAMVVACPLCHSNLDFQYLTQLVGLAIGLPAERLGLHRHFVPVRVEELMPVVGASRV